MKYRRLGKSGLKISEISFGSWITFGSSLTQNIAKQCMQKAFDSGVNFFDNAEVYAKGESEKIMGAALKDFPRDELIVSTKIFWGGEAPTQKGLSRKHLVEGTKNSLKRLQLEYVDLLFCHRPDPETPIEETVRAMDFIIKSGLAFYWGTSEWSAQEIEEAYRVAEKYNCIPPTMEQPQYNMFVRERFEDEYKSLFEKHKLGTTIWSPLASGFLTGKYTDTENQSTERAHWVKQHITEEKHQRVRELKTIAQELECSMAQLALAWCLKNPNVSTVITGASKVEQVSENIKAITIKDKLDETVMKRIDDIL